MSKGGGSTTSTVSQNNIPTQLAPYVTDELGQAQGLDQSGNLTVPYYSGQTVAPFSNATTQSQNMISNLASQGSPLQSAADSSLTNIANGSEINSNPYIDQAYNSAARSLTNTFQNTTQPGIASQFNAAGRYGSGLYQNAQGQADQALGTSLGDLSNSMYYQNANDAQGRQLLAATSAPSVEAGDYLGATALNSVGTQQQTQQQNLDNAAQQQYYYNPQLNALSQYSALIQGMQPNSYSPSTTQTTAPNTSSLASLFGLGTSIAGLGTGGGASLGGDALTALFGM